MSLDRFVKANLVLCPLVVAAGYLYYDSLPIVALPLGVAYVTFVVLLTFAWGMSHLSLAMDS